MFKFKYDIEKIKDNVSINYSTIIDYEGLVFLIKLFFDRNEKLSNDFEIIFFDGESNVIPYPDFILFTNEYVANELRKEIKNLTKLEKQLISKIIIIENEDIDSFFTTKRMVELISAGRAPAKSNWYPVVMIKESSIFDF